MRLFYICCSSYSVYNLPLCFAFHSVLISMRNIWWALRTESSFAYRLHTLYSGLISEREIKVKAQRGVFVSMHRKMGRRYNACATEIFKPRDIGAGHMELFTELFAIE